MSSVLITGASRGIGRATALELSRRGHRVIATARSVEALKDLPVDMRLRLDVTDQASVDAAVAAAEEIDVLVSNAGETLRAPVESVPLREVERLFQLNTLGALRVTQAVLPAMRNRGSGRIVYVSSVLGRIAIPLLGAYAASKWALEAIAETLAVEAGPLGVHVTILEPGGVSSGGGERAPVYLTADDPYRPLLAQLAALRAEPVTVEDVARIVAATIDDSAPPLRIPIGDLARDLLAERKAFRDDQPFRAAPTGDRPRSSRR
jgi:NAD(P)-dependent dehydrogenase (short-subunit alcohol dehydrogenase family)